MTPALVMKPLFISSFEVRKSKILEELNRPAEQYNDLSPKGTVDEGIRDLLDYINSLPGFVSTSSCAGRVSVFLEGVKESQRANADIVEQDADTQNQQRNTSEGVVASSGGKGGGQWLFVSHDPIPKDTHDGQRLALSNILRTSSTRTPGHDERTTSAKLRFVHFKFEAMILHILTRSLEDAQFLLAAAAQAGFRESGAMNLSVDAEGSITPMVAVRSAGMGFDSVIAYEDDRDGLIRLVDDAYLETLISIANERFIVNSERIQRFRAVLQRTLKDNSDYEDAATRRARKRAEGLAKQQKTQEKQTGNHLQSHQPGDDPGVSVLFES